MFATSPAIKPAMLQDEAILAIYNYGVHRNVAEAVVRVCDEDGLKDVVTSPSWALFRYWKSMCPNLQEQGCETGEELVSALEIFGFREEIVDKVPKDKKFAQCVSPDADVSPVGPFFLTESRTAAIEWAKKISNGLFGGSNPGVLFTYELNVDALRVYDFGEEYSGESYKQWQKFVKYNWFEAETA